MFNRSLRKMVGVTLISFPILLSGGFYNAQEAQEYERVEFTLINNTDRTIEKFYVSAPSENTWGDNILDVPLAPGKEALVTIDDGLPDCKYDLMATFGPGAGVGEGDVYQTNVEICDGTEYIYSN